jgi:hypothetical protein
MAATFGEKARKLPDILGVRDASGMDGHVPGDVLKQLSDYQRLTSGYD